VTEYVLLAETRAELAAAVLYYESQPGGRAAAFIGSFERALLLIRQYPEIGTPVGQVERQVRLRRFPYRVVYRRDPDLLVILAIAHTGRRQGYWRTRE